MAISTKNVTDDNGNGGFTRKNLEPGNHLCTIQGISMKKAEHIRDKDEYQIILNLEGPEIGGNFVGFMIDQNDPSKGTHKGQSSLVKLSQWNYRNGETAMGRAVDRDEEILKDLKRLCQELGGVCVEWYDKIDERQFPTIEDVIAAFNKERPFASIKLHFCIAGKKYTNKKGYTAYELFLPRKSDLGRPYCKDESKVQKYFPSIHIVESKAKEVDSFSADNVQSTGSTQNNSTKQINTNNIETASEVNEEKKDDDVPFTLG